VPIGVAGAIEFGARVVLDAIEHRKHAIVMNAELDGRSGTNLNLQKLGDGPLSAKVDLPPGTDIDAMGGYLTYGPCEVLQRPRRANSSRWAWPRGAASSGPWRRAES
jgi:predicted homoserine dehydrogenase-like protein